MQFRHPDLVHHQFLAVWDVAVDLDVGTDIGHAAVRGHLLDHILVPCLVALGLRQEIVTVGDPAVAHVPGLVKVCRSRVDEEPIRRNAVDPGKVRVFLR